MANRPPFLCELEKDKFIDGQIGFVDTFNWAVRAIDNLEGGKNCNVDWTLPDHPVIDVDLPESISGSAAAVYDVYEDTLSGDNGLTITYTDDREDKFIPLSGGGSVTFYGTDNSATSAANSFNISAASNSNVVVTASGTTLTIGVYYI